MQPRYKYKIYPILILPTVQVAAFMCGDTQQALTDVYGVGLTRGRRLPLIQVTSDVTKTTLTVSLTQVPTTSGTGSEVTNISVITTGQAEKKGVVGPQLYADYAVLDGDLTLTLPPSVTAATGENKVLATLQLIILHSVQVLTQWCTLSRPTPPDT